MWPQHLLQGTCTCSPPLPADLTLWWLACRPSLLCSQEDLFFNEKVPMCSNVTHATFEKKMHDFLCGTCMLLWLDRIHTKWGKWYSASYTCLSDNCTVCYGIVIFSVGNFCWGIRPDPGKRTHTTLAPNSLHCRRLYLAYVAGSTAVGGKSAE